MMQKRRMIPNHYAKMVGVSRQAIHQRMQRNTVPTVTVLEPVKYIIVDEKTIKDGFKSLPVAES